MSADEHLQTDMDLKGFGMDGNEIKALAIEEKAELLKSFRNSMTQNTSPKQVDSPARTCSSEPGIESERRRLLKGGVSLTSLSKNHPPEETEQDEIQVVAELVTPRRTTFQGPSSRLLAEKTPATLHDKEPPGQTIKSPLINCNRSRRKIVMGKKPDQPEQVHCLSSPETKRQPGLLPSQDYAKRLPEIYQVDPLDCVDKSESTLRRKSPMLEKKSILRKPFFATDYALSLNADDYNALWAKMFGYERVVTEPEQQQNKPEVQEMPSISEPGPSNKPDSLFDEAPTIYNLRQRTATKRSAANTYDFNISDDSDSESIMPSKKINRTEDDDDDLFLPLTENLATKRPSHTMTTPVKPRGGRMNLVATAAKAAAVRKAAAATKNMTIVESDESGDSDVPGKEVVEPKLSYSPAELTGGRWKTSKPKVSATPGNVESVRAELDDLGLEPFLKVNKPKQPRAKPSDVLKPRQISGKERRNYYNGNLSPVRRVRSKTNISECSNDDTEQEVKKFECPMCKEMFTNREIETHASACFEEAGTAPAFKCPLCFKDFSETEINAHCDTCQGAEPEEMDVNNMFT